MLAQIDAIRHDLDGNGASTAGAGTTAYNAAFPDREAGATGRMGCPATCKGYELMADLDFDTGMAGDRTDDTYYNGGAGWTPIRGAGAIWTYQGIFQGNGYTIANLHINAGTTVTYVGLFGSVYNGHVSGVGLPNASVTGSADSVAIGALVGRL